MCAHEVSARPAPLSRWSRKPAGSRSTCAHGRASGAPLRSSKYAVSQVVGLIKGKSAIHLARVYGERKRNFVGQHFWARGYFVNTVGRDEQAIRDYIRNQEKEDQRLDQLHLWR
jgi:REP-associated tyrosine transposase